MSDSVRTLTVVLTHDMDVQDEVEFVVNAIKMLRGVAEVTLGPPNDIAAYTARLATKSELDQRIRRVMATTVNGEWSYELHQAR